MGTWGTSIKDSDTFADVYDGFYELYNKGEQPDLISKKVIDENRDILEIEEERNNLWFAIALAQWETKSLDTGVLSIVENIISSDADLDIWRSLEASEADIKKRKIALHKFLEKIKSDRPKAKPRKRTKIKSPVFATGDCLIFNMSNGNYGGAVVLASDHSGFGYNLVATTRINQILKPTLADFNNAEVLVCNFAEWRDKVSVAWYMPDSYHRDYSGLYELAGRLPVKIEYDVNDYQGKGYLPYPSYTTGWDMNDIAEMQFESEMTKAKPVKTVTIKQLTKKRKWWNIVKKNWL